MPYRPQTTSRDTSVGGGSWPHASTTDDRVPWYTWEYQEQVYGFFFLDIFCWLEMGIFVLMGCSMAAFTGVVIYYTILPRTTSTNRTAITATRPKDGAITTTNMATMRFLMGWGVLMPLWIWGPWYLVNMFGVYNKIFRFVVCVLSPIPSIFRIMEAMYGYAPEPAVRSLAHYAFYFASPFTLSYNSSTNNYVRASKTAAIRHFLRFVMFLFATGMYASLFTLLDAFPTLGDTTSHPDPQHDPMTTTRRRTIVWASWSALWWSDMTTHWTNTALYAVLFQLFLTTFGEGHIAVLALLIGIQAEPVMDNPLFTTRSPSDFWGKRWNRIVHTCLKNGVYKPVRFYYGGSKALAVTMAFVASGLFHELLLPVVMYNYQHMHGYAMAFFLWQAALIVLEHGVVTALSGSSSSSKHHDPNQETKNRRPSTSSSSSWWRVWIRTPWDQLPRPIQTALVVALGIPLGAWFTPPYVQTDFFSQGLVFFPTRRPISQQSSS